MAKILQGIFGAVQGKVGSLVGSSYKGIPVLKSKAASVANPQTAGQVEQRDRMTASVAFAKAILSQWIKPLWDRFAVKMSGYNLWVQKNVASFVAGSLTDPSTLIMSVGNMASTQIDSIVADVSDHTINMSWQPDTDGFHLATDNGFLLIFNETQNTFLVNSSFTRTLGNVIFSDATFFTTGDVLHSWLAFKRVNGLYISLASYSAVSVIA